VREGQAQLDLCNRSVGSNRDNNSRMRAACLVGNGLGVGSSLDGDSDSGRASSESRTGEAEGVHDG
jgi:hypothetical protein